MKRRIMSVCFALLLMTNMLLISTANVEASSDDPILDGSYLTDDEESIGYDTKITRGEDLLTGYSKCVRLGPGELYAGGTTIAAHTVANVQVSVIVERAQEGDTAWSLYDSWHKENENMDRVASNRSLQVEGGYYYRVRCTHSANSDMSSSFTNGVYIEEP
ncbi:hypothetical protein ACQRBH_03555 [Bariatricus sp. SGI.161]|uniref:hypothetical protein n=1 Tax=Bariatricus sp. SGI.161 TaxID=3420550 RepID=UPI003D013C76